MAFLSEHATPSDASPMAPPASDRPPVRLNRDRTISPTLLKAFQECPHQVRLRYIDHLQTPRQYNHHLSQGRIAHDLLAMVARRMQRGIPLPTRSELHDLARRRVPHGEFPTPEAHADAVRQIVRWAETGAMYLQRDPDGQIMRIERPLTRAFGQDDPLQVSFRPDLVRWTADADGEYLEIIDYKTGKRWLADDVGVIARFVINGWLEREGNRAWQVPVRFTWVWLDRGERDSVGLDPETCTAPWQAVTAVVERLFAETAWLPTPSHRCRWCPFYRNPCRAADTASPGLLFEGPGD
ncbi:MAG: PD-(D/E)XK nuclease family protein [Thermomicrobiales bacterium]